MVEMRKKDVPGPRLLRLWLDKNERSIGWLASLLGVSRPMVSRWVSGQDMPSPQARRALEDATGAFVKVDDWFSQDELEFAYKFSTKDTKFRRRLRRRMVEARLRGGEEITDEDVSQA